MHVPLFIATVRSNETASRVMTCGMHKPDVSLKSNYLSAGAGPRFCQRARMVIIGAADLVTLQAICLSLLLARL